MWIRNFVEGSAMNLGKATQKARALYTFWPLGKDVKAREFWQKNDGFMLGLPIELAAGNSLAPKVN